MQQNQHSENWLHFLVNESSVVLHTQKRPISMFLNACFFQYSVCALVRSVQLHNNVHFRRVCPVTTWKCKPIQRVTTFHIESSWNLPMQTVWDIFSPWFDIFTAAQIQQGGMVFHLRSSRHSKDKKKKKSLLKHSTVTSLSRKHVSVTPDTLQTRLSSFHWHFLLVNVNYITILGAAFLQRNHPIQKVPVNYHE